MAAVHIGVGADSRSLERAFSGYAPRVERRPADNRLNRTSTLLTMNVATWSYALVVLAESL